MRPVVPASAAIHKTVAVTDRLFTRKKGYGPSKTFFYFLVS